MCQSPSSRTTHDLKTILTLCDGAPQFFQAFNSYTLWSFISDITEWQVYVLSILFGIVSVGNILTTLLTLLEKYKRTGSKPSSASRAPRQRDKEGSSPEESPTNSRRSLILPCCCCAQHPTSPLFFRWWRLLGFSFRKHTPSTAQHPKGPKEWELLKRHLRAQPAVAMYRFPPQIDSSSIEVPVACTFLAGSTPRCFSSCACYSSLLSHL